jgi:hypothetical protein
MVSVVSDDTNNLAADAPPALQEQMILWEYFWHGQHICTHDPPFSRWRALGLFYFEVSPLTY